MDIHKEELNELFKNIDSTNIENSVSQILKEIYTEWFFYEHNFNTIAPISATIISLGGIVFQIGKHSEKLDLLNNKVYAQEKKVDENYKYINDMKIFMSRSDEKLDDINISIKEIKNKLDKMEDKIYFNYKVK